MVSLKSSLALLLWLCTFSTVFAQAKFTISGYIKDATNGEALIGASIYIKEAKTGVTTNPYGFYSVTLPSLSYTLEITYIGYQRVEKQVVLDKDIRLDIELPEQSEQLQEVVISADAEQGDIVKKVEMGTNKLSMSTIRKMPALLGEVDVIKSIQMLPGVSTVGEGASGFNVRGGSTGQNQILLDEAPVYNSSHMLGFFSVFNPDAVKDTKLYKAGVPARYGGRLASLLDVRMKEGNSKEFEATGGVGTVFSRLAVEGPIAKDKASFIVAARRSYIDVLAAPLLDGLGLNFYDITAKTNYNINAKNRVYASGYFGRDNFIFGDDQGFNWGNQTGTIRWNKIINDKLFANITAVYSSYDYQIKYDTDDINQFSWISSISNTIVKPEFSYFLNGNNEITFGGEAIYYTFDPARIKNTTNGESTENIADKKYALEAAAYISNNQKIGEKIGIEYGLRLSQFRQFGGGTFYTFDNPPAGKRKNIIKSEEFSKSETVKTYINAEPRISIRYELADNNSLKVSYNRTAQYIHLISNTTASTPTDIWTPSSRNIKPQIGDQYSIGYFRNFGVKNSWETSAEIYFRETKNQVDYIDGADLQDNLEFLEGELLNGQGRAYGIELYVQKKTGRLNGWLSYTYSKSEYKVDGINRGEWYAARYDQPHSVKFAGFFEVNNRWSISTNFTYATGTPTTFPTSRYLSQGILIPYNANESRNGIRLADYHRLDLGVRLEGKKFKRSGKGRRNDDYWVFSLYNVYSRKNAFSINFSQADERLPAGEPHKSQATQISIIGSVIPSVSYNFKF